MMNFLFDVSQNLNDIIKKTGEINIKILQFFDVGDFALPHTDAIRPILPCLVVQAVDGNACRRGACVMRPVDWVKMTKKQAVMIRKHFPNDWRKQELY